ncbi:uncharacterized protein F4822DRAFT_400949 [Hypoxylon trugodes]|uniref:uncharacterized protein n=1 Tax=Hypoxylon trugodes TaxID=326681 RepID=UPI00219A6CA2|nr:uncharacterized protein F4822DRAFT_400949 [Hypoxylon trugodes]KAI1390130.1 hypothetical protein F4822DRAFT_400949 [Hypoxylon trugodes]
MAPYAHQTPSTHANPDELFHALLRPAILQILRAQGYYSSTPQVADAVTELAARYMVTVAERAVHQAGINDETGAPAIPDLVDVRLALDHCGAFMPERDFASQLITREEDTRGVDDFIRWATGKKNQKIRKVAALDKPTVAEVGVEGVEEQRETDYLSALKRKHNKTDQDSKWAGTILGQGITTNAEVSAEEDSILAWNRKRHEAAEHPPQPETVDVESRPPSSGLSSLADEDMAMMDMDFS